MASTALKPEEAALCPLLVSFSPGERPTQNGNQDLGSEVVSTASSRRCGDAQRGAGVHVSETPGANTQTARAENSMDLVEFQSAKVKADNMRSAVGQERKLQRHEQQLKEVGSRTSSSTPHPSPGDTTVATIVKLRFVRASEQSQSIIEVEVVVPRAKVRSRVQGDGVISETVVRTGTGCRHEIKRFWRADTIRGVFIYITSCSKQKW